MKKVVQLFALGIVGTGIVFACTQATTADANTATVATNNTEATATETTMDATDKDVNVSDWPETSQKAAKAMMEKYGHPKEHTPTMLVWENTGPFKRTIVYKEEINHDFPMPHKDVLEQFINYEVPLDKYDDLAMFDGSVICERTKGEMSARCDKEGANILALNLAHDVARGNKSVENARSEYANSIMNMLQGNMPANMQKLQFDASRGNVGDSDKTIMDMSKVKQLKKDMK